MQRYTEIFVDPECLPRIDATLVSDPDYRDRLLKSARYGLGPYIKFVSNLRGVFGRKDVLSWLDPLVDQFLVQFWDMPASPGEHHAYPWGYVLHGLYVGCAEAEKASQWRPHGAFSSQERKHAELLGFAVLAHFYTGLVRNTYRLYEYTIVSAAAAGSVTFDPARGSDMVLDFKLRHPNHTVVWNELGGSRTKFGCVHFMESLQEDVRRQIPDTAMQALDFLAHEGRHESEDASIARDAELSQHPSTEERYRLGFSAYFNERAGETNPAGHVYRLDETWTAVDAAQFFEKLRMLIDGVHSLDGITGYLLRQNILAGSHEPHALKTAFQIRYPDGKTISKDERKLCFIATPYLRSVCPVLDSSAGEILFTDKGKLLLRGLGIQASVEDGNFCHERSGTASSPATIDNAPSGALNEWGRAILCRMQNYTAQDIDMDNGWLFVADDRVYAAAQVILTIVSTIKSRRQCTLKDVWQEMEDAGFLLSLPRSQEFEVYAPSGETRRMSGLFFEFSLPEELHSDILRSVFVGDAFTNPDTNRRVGF
ncbi:hypothetical protein KL86DPRO_60225 [uncultured delta proteobacterium]|uniref:Uncharacterized protein n=1 Tax=uncultured delta proteobacterium TaxID=34034 RepID=A0A212KG60_9DELT|nr:hypothetical protein KL86DPRO_60225 [uncultured delta proteobacterium]